MGQLVPKPRRDNEGPAWRQFALFMMANIDLPHFDLIIDRFQELHPDVLDEIAKDEGFTHKLSGGKL